MELANAKDKRPARATASELVRSNTDTANVGIDGAGYVGVGAAAAWRTLGIRTIGDHWCDPWGGAKCQN